MNRYELPQPAAPWPSSDSPYAAPPQWTPRRVARPGIETRQVLLTLGALCLVVALSAGTALVWSALGRGGQEALMLSITGLLLLGAATVRRLPATAEAFGAVGLAGCVIDAISARTLHLPAAVDLSLHSYVAIAAVAVGAVASAVAVANPRLVSAPLGWSSAVTVAVVAATNPSGIDRAALLAPVGAAVAIAVDNALRRSAAAAGVRVVNAALGGIVTVAGFVAALAAIAHHDAPGLYGVAVPLALLALPILVGDPKLVGDDATAALSGVTAALMVMAAGFHTDTNTRTAEALTLPVVAAYVLLINGGDWVRRVQIMLSTLAVPGAMAWISLVADTQRFANVDFVLAVAAAGVAVLWPRSRPGATAARAVAFGTAAMLASIAVDVTLHVHGVTTPEAYLATPAGLMLVWAGTALMRDRQLPSAVLIPGLAVSLFPTLVMALGHDHARQAILLVAATVIVCIGGQLRLGTPLAAGGGIIVLLGVRIAGPQLIELPHWVMWFAAGSVLLTLGATWEARVQDARRLRGALRPRIAALR